MKRAVVVVYARVGDLDPGDIIRFMDPDPTNPTLRGWYKVVSVTPGAMPRRARTKDLGSPS